MAKEHKKLPSNRFGARYGAKNREKVGNLEKQYKQKLEDPITGKIGGVKRLASGIYVSKKTGIKFAGRAYTPDRSQI
ncbi:MAG: 50S ribosomal protein L37ae [Candidatus Woesearchaeota archaeon]